MGTSEIIIGLGGIIAGLKSLKEGLSSVGSGLEDLRYGEFHSGDEPKGRVIDIGNRIDERVKYIKQMILKGKIDPKVRSFAVRIVTSRCAKCRYCGSLNIVSHGGAGKGSIKGAYPGRFIDSENWKCGKCKRPNNMNATHWCVPEKNWRKEVIAVFNAVKNNIRYTRDIERIDTFQSPNRSLEWGGGDCDDYTIVLASLLQTIGYPVKLRVMWTKDAKTGKPAPTWGHILLLAGLPPRGPTEWMPLDASVSHPAGWYPPAQMVHKVKDYPVR